MGSVGQASPIARERTSYVASPLDGSLLVPVSWKFQAGLTETAVVDATTGVRDGDVTSAGAVWSGVLTGSWVTQDASTRCTWDLGSA